MNDKERSQSRDSELETRIVALVMGEVSELERDELASLLNERPELAAFRQEMEQVHGLLSDIGSGDAVSDDEDWTLSPSKRDAVLAVIDKERTPAVRSRPASKLAEYRLRTKRVGVRHFVTIAASIAATVFFVSLLFHRSFQRTASDVRVAGGLSTSREFGAERRSGDSAKSAASWYSFGEATTEPEEAFELDGDVNGDGNANGIADFDDAMRSKSVAKLDDNLEMDGKLPTPYYLEDDVQFFPAQSKPDASGPATTRFGVQADDLAADSPGHTVDFSISGGTSLPAATAGRADADKSLGVAQQAAELQKELSDVEQLNEEMPSANRWEFQDPAKPPTATGSGALWGGFELDGGLGSESEPRLSLPSSGLKYEEPEQGQAAAEPFQKRRTLRGQTRSGSFGNDLSERDFELGFESGGTGGTARTRAPAAQPGTANAMAAGDAAPSDEATISDEATTSERATPSVDTIRGLSTLDSGLAEKSFSNGREQKQIEGKALEPRTLPFEYRSQLRNYYEQNAIPNQVMLGESVTEIGKEAKPELRGRHEDTPASPAEGFERFKRNSANNSASAAGLNEILASDDAFSTFSLNVSDVSFKLANAALAKGEWPDASRIRIEDFVNAFDYGDPLPSQLERVACRLEQVAHPFIQQRNLLRVSLRTAATGRSGSTPLRLTLLLDNSGSMERIDRRQTVRRAFQLLVQQLQPGDQVTLLSFARQPRLLADKVSGADAQQLVGLIESLPSEGGTNIELALRLAFEKAKEQWIADAQNRIILLTDGAVNLGDADPESLSRTIEAMRAARIAFDAAGISAEGLNDEVLEALARKGDGRYYLLDSPDAADQGFANQIAGALRPSAMNVKVQVEFNPERVGRYKLLGFEKHRLRQQDFRNDEVDAAEMAAAEAGVALYQFEADPNGRGDIGSVSVRFRDVSSGQMIEKRWPIPYQDNAPRLDQADSSMRIAAAAALLAAKLRGDAVGQNVELKSLSQLVSTLPARDRNRPRIQALQQMIDQARQLSGN